MTIKIKNNNQLLTAPARCKNLFENQTKFAVPSFGRQSQLPVQERRISQAGIFLPNNGLVVAVNCAQPLALIAMYPHTHTHTHTNIV